MTELSDKAIALHALMMAHQRQYNETATTTHLAECMGMVQPNLVRYLDELEKAGLAVRQQPPLRHAWRAIERKEK